MKANPYKKIFFGKIIIIYLYIHTNYKKIISLNKKKHNLILKEEDEYLKLIQFDYDY